LKVALHGASTLANRAHLSPEYLQNLWDLYAGTALERQELYGELIDVVEGALWRGTDIIRADNDWLVGNTLSVIGVDPGLTTGGDATGIVTVRASQERAITMRKALVVEDWTEPGLGPEQWAARVITAWQTEKDLTGTVPIVVAEKNAGGEMVAATLEGQVGEREVPITLVSAIRSKAARAEPIVLAYRKDRVRHLADMELLVDEQTTWEPPTPGVSRGSGWSPNRLDALVLAATTLLVDDSALRRFGKLAVEETSEVLNVPQERWKRDRGPQGLTLPWRRE
jgi:phage terminase large subunit-like protein